MKWKKKKTKKQKNEEKNKISFDIQRAYRTFVPSAYGTAKQVRASNFQ